MNDYYDVVGVTQAAVFGLAIACEYRCSYQERD